MPDLTIAGQTFVVDDDPTIQVGTPMNEGHVHTLQQTRRENIRNNFAKRVSEALNGGGELHDDKRTELQRALNEYAANYQFGVRSATGGRRVTDPLEKEMTTLARQDILAKLKAAGRKPPSAEDLSNAVGQLLSAKRADYERRAKRNLREREAAANSLLEEAGLTGEPAPATA